MMQYNFPWIMRHQFQCLRMPSLTDPYSALQANNANSSAAVATAATGNSLPSTAVDAKAATAAATVPSSASAVDGSDQVSNKVCNSRQIYIKAFHFSVCGNLEE